MMSEFKLRPVGYQVMIEMEEVEETTESGIVIATHTELKREQHGHSIGWIRAFGPICYKGFEGCESPEDFGVQIGDKVEFSRYDGKESIVEHLSNYRIIPDVNIIQVVYRPGEDDE
jgi:co-chaperonin GroES (HSP10)